MIIEFDPSNSTVILDYEDGTPAHSRVVDRLIVTFSPPGLVAAATMERDSLEISLTPVSGPPIEVRLIPTAKRRWTTVFSVSSEKTKP